MRLRQFMVTIKFMAHVDMSLNVGQDGHQLVLQVLDIILQEIFIRRLYLFYLFLYYQFFLI
jgi:hypothetical protein